MLKLTCNSSSVQGFGGIEKRFVGIRRSPSIGILDKRQYIHFIQNCKYLIDTQPQIYIEQRNVFTEAMVQGLEEDLQSEIDKMIDSGEIAASEYYISAYKIICSSIVQLYRDTVTSVTPDELNLTVRGIVATTLIANPSILTGMDLDRFLYDNYNFVVPTRFIDQLSTIHVTVGKSLVDVAAATAVLTIASSIALQLLPGFEQSNFQLPLGDGTTLAIPNTLLYSTAFLISMVVSSLGVVYRIRDSKMYQERMVQKVLSATARGESRLENEV